jgi:acetyl esterase/lipase
MFSFFLGVVATLCGLLLSVLSIEKLTLKQFLFTSMWRRKRSQACALIAKQSMEEATDAFSPEFIAMRQLAVEMKAKMDRQMPSDIQHYFSFMRKQTRPVVRGLERTTQLLISNVSCTWVVYPGVRKDAPVIVFLHGGGFIVGCTEMALHFCSALSRMTGCRVLGVDFRRPPEV